MKRALMILLIIVLTFLIVSSFIPATRESQIFISSPFENIISSTFTPKNWLKWDSLVWTAWEHDSSSCHLSFDRDHQTAIVEIPEKKIQIRQSTYLLYQLEETKNNRNSFFSFSIIPFVGNGLPRSQHNTKIAYAQRTNLLYKVFPFLDGASFAERTMSGLKTYLENTTRFYGYAIQLQIAPDTLFLIKKKVLTKQQLFTALPLLFNQLDQYARQNHCEPGLRNISFNFQDADNFSVMAGININQPITGDDTFNFMQLPKGQILAVGHFNGFFRERLALYRAMEKYILDHQLIKSSVSFEKYLSQLPSSDSSMINIELSYPMRY